MFFFNLYNLNMRQPVINLVFIVLYICETVVGCIVVW